MAGKETIIYVGGTLSVPLDHTQLHDILYKIVAPSENRTPCFSCVCLSVSFMTGNMAPQAPSPLAPLSRRMTAVTKPTDIDGLILEAWAQGYMIGSIIIMICITVSNMRRGVFLHKLILLEVYTH